jgi:hydrogenase maturation protease
MEEKKILILGIGNVLLSDEGIGVHVLRKLEKMDLPKEYELVDGGTFGFELITFFTNKKKVIIIDCIKAEEKPGTIIWAKPDELNLQWQVPFSVHHGGLSELIKSAEMISPTPEIFILGIVPEDVNTMNTSLSKTLQSKFDGIVEKAYKLITGNSKLNVV